MSDHELWNELGNLYFLSGSYSQAANAYRKAIQLERDYGKPYSNLAMLYAKQSKHEEAIKLYKKSLDLLTDDTESAITWNRLGNVYRQLKRYQEALFAYQCADNLTEITEENLDASNQMLYVSSESESMPYEVIEDQHNIHQNHTDFALDEEPEFDESLPDLVPIEAEVRAEKIQEGPANDSKTVQVPSLPVEMSNSAYPAGSESPELSESVAKKNIDRSDSKADPIDGLEEDDLSEKILNGQPVLEPDSSILTENSNIDEDNNIPANESTQENLEKNTNSDKKALATDDFDFSEPIAQVEEEVETLPIGSMKTKSDIVSISKKNAQNSDEELTDSISQVKHDIDPPSNEPELTSPEAELRVAKDAQELNAEVSDFVEPNTSTEEAVEAMPTEDQPINAKLDTGLEPVNPNAQAEDGSEIDMDCSELVPVDTSKNMEFETVNEDNQKGESEIGTEEEKLAKQIEINPRSATTWEALGTLYKTAGRYEEAIQAFNQAISIAPSEVSYYHNLGLVYAAQGNNKDAFNTFQKVLELNPNHSLTHASLGGYYKKMGLEELAQRHIGKAMKHIYESENEYNRACLDAICGNNDQAIELLRIALENKQTFVEWVLNDPDLDSLHKDERFQNLIAEFSK